MIIAFTGAGISAESGIPTFGEMPGIRDILTRTYANKHPEKYRRTISRLKNLSDIVEPNDAHYALAEYHIPVISMNIDNLHERAGTEHLLKIHGRLPTDEELDHCDKLHNAPILYGDPAPNYQIALSVLDAMRPGDILLIIGSSGYTQFSGMLPTFAMAKLIQVHTINCNAGTEVRKFLENHKESLDTWEHFIYNSPCDSEWLNDYM